MTEFVLAILPFLSYNSAAQNIIDLLLDLYEAEATKLNLNVCWKTVLSVPGSLSFLYSDIEKWTPETRQ